MTPTFIPPDALTMKGYELLASPTLYSGQVVSLRVEADKSNTAAASLSALVKLYGPADEPEALASDVNPLPPGSRS